MGGKVMVIVESFHDKGLKIRGEILGNKNGVSWISFFISSFSEPSWKEITAYCDSKEEVLAMVDNLITSLKTSMEIFKLEKEEKNGRR